MKRLALFLLLPPLFWSGPARAEFSDLQLNSSADLGEGFGYSDTIGGNGIYNAYLSENNGASFLNTGDGTTTSIHLPTSIVGTFTYQFFYSNAFANTLTLQLWSADRSSSSPGIVVSTHRDSPGSAFISLFDPATVPPFEYPNGTPLGLSQTQSGGYIITLKEFAFTNGSGPAAAYSVTPGALNSPEIIGQFTYEVASVPEPATISFVGIGLGFLAFRHRARI